MESIEKTLYYHELIMTLDNLKNINCDTTLPQGYSFEFYQGAQDIVDWANIHISSKEFTSYDKAVEYFHQFYDGFAEQLNTRLFFIVYNNQKIATATLSPADEQGYKCVIDWLAISQEHQGKKLAKPLIFKCLQLAKDLDYDKILLHTQTHTWLAAKLYLDMGFEPYNIEQEYKGWQILKTITNHPKLKDVNPIAEQDMFDPLAVNIVNQLNQMYTGDYSYEIWYINGLNDVYVNYKGKFVHYKFYDNGNTLKQQTKSK